MSDRVVQRALRREMVIVPVLVHGMAGLDLRRLRWLHRNDRDSYRYVRDAIAEAEGIDRREVDDYVGLRHGRDCACWRCIGRTQLAVMRFAAERRVKKGAAMEIEMDDVEDKVTITPAEAESLLADGEYVHNYANPAGGLLLGVDYDRADAIAEFAKAIAIEIGGDGCKSMGHPIVVWHSKDRYTFFAADMEKVKKFEADRAAGVAS
jgi:hypothetical protein